MIVPKQDEYFKLHTPGQLCDATEFICDYVQPGADLWDTDVPCDVLLVKNEIFEIIPDLALVYPVSDCPVLIIRTKDTLSISHCGGAQIDRELPAMAIEAVREKIGSSNYDDIAVSIGPFAQPGSYVYDEGQPKYARNNNVWDGCLRQEGDLVYVDMINAIQKQIYKKVCRHFFISKADTVTDDRFYSNCAGRLDPTKKGRHLVGAYCKRR
jgi:copper oxidase (laccase) domain-containing protein